MRQLLHPLIRIVPLALFLLTMGKSSHAQQAPVVRAYLPNTSEEDWSFLQDSSKKRDWWDPLKYISLGAEGRYLTLSGEARFRAEGFRVRGLEGAPSSTDSYLLQRYLVGADLHLSPHFRVFGEIQSGIVTGKLNSPRPTDKDIIDLHQGFFEWRQPLKKSVFGLKAGRQEVEIGSSRLISASPGLNVKRSFDGIILYYKGESWRFAAVAARLVRAAKGAFDDLPDHQQTFWGVAASRKSFLFNRGEFALYYLGVDQARAVYTEGIGRDQRQTAGVKWSGSGSRIDLNYDGILQWGAFKNSSVRAWAFSTETGYRLPRTRFSPRISFRVDVASGDKDPMDSRLQSFNPLFPGNSYAGAVGLLGPTNLTDFTPTLTFRLKSTLILGLEVPSYWRTSTGDGIYATDQRLILPPSIGQGRYVGTNPGLVIMWQATGHLQFQGAITRFLAGGFLGSTLFAHGFGFYSATALYRF